MFCWIFFNTTHRGRGCNIVIYNCDILDKPPLVYWVWIPFLCNLSDHSVSLAFVGRTCLKFHDYGIFSHNCCINFELFIHNSWMSRAENTYSQITIKQFKMLKLKVDLKEEIILRMLRKFTHMYGWVEIQNCCVSIAFSFLASLRC